MKVKAEEVMKFPFLQDLEKERSNDIYLESPFYSLKVLCSKTKGSKMEKVVEHIMKQNSVQILKKEKGSKCDRRVDASSSLITELAEHSLFEFKGSFLWAPDWNCFRWQQLRQADHATGYIFSAYYPDRLEMFFCSKEELYNNLEDAKYKQHGGKNKKGNTQWFAGMPEDFPFLKKII